MVLRGYFKNFSAKYSPRSTEKTDITTDAKMYIIAIRRCPD